MARPSGGRPVGGGRDAGRGVGGSGALLAAGNQKFVIDNHSH